VNVPGQTTSANAGAREKSSSRITVDGKFFRSGARKFHIKGITYGPFAPNPEGTSFCSPEQTRRDFEQLRDLQANLLRVYYVPPPWFLDLAAEHDLKILIDVPWPKHLCFLESYDVQLEARQSVRQAVTACKGHPAVFAYSVVNEIPAEIVRWSGVAQITRFIEELIQDAKVIDPECLCTFASFPPTEFLQPRNIDFFCFNVYLHQTHTFEAYLARLQMLADAKPLLLGEFGIDSIREGEESKSELLKSQIEIACRAGLAGTIIYSFTDDWFSGGRQVDDWAFGLTNRQRQPKASFRVVQQLYACAPYFTLSRVPKVSVIVASYNGGRTLEACLTSLTKLNYPDYEVILVDDGSTDRTQEIARRFPGVRNIRHENMGLSAARNTGIKAAMGEVVAFTDSDCRADEDWLYYLVGDLIRGNFIGIGGHNFLPPEDSPSAAAVLVSPGGPAHVMLTDQEAEHIPGCNMAFYKWALDEINGFDPVFRKAGDDVDLCWRLQGRGWKIGFSPAGFVWHYRRSNVRAYLKQQAGYGEAEALLIGKHPENFNQAGGGIWHGRIYAPAKYGLLLRRGIIYHGIFGSGFFQKLYSPAPAHALMLFTSIEYHLGVNFPLMILSSYFPIFLPLAVVSIALSLAVCILAAAQAELPPTKTRIWSRPLVACLFFLQPLVRGWSRYRTRLHLRSESSGQIQPKQLSRYAAVPVQLCFWSCKGVDRYAFLKTIVRKFTQQNLLTTPDSGWDPHDLEMVRSPWTHSSLTTASEYLEEGRIFLRCRLAAKWSVLSIVAFSILLVIELLLISDFAESEPWLWMMLPLLPLLAWFFEDECHHQTATMANLVQDAASELNLEAVKASVS
jgi:glycosyltransferase involved in cell wall biosynthesis